ncbi:T-box transcription factor TBX6 [Calliopsis andreniformis]|uniref:T-box transcription factor TBX6 n=1 Tax=Calliopsis andreniformis TaxID=337506 RepID=UPI003FCCD6A8
MNSIMAMPMELQLQLHQQMLFRQQQIVLRRHRSDMPSSNMWMTPSFGEGPPLSPEVKVELENRELWQQFHAETTEMIITKLGRRMFPSIQLTITGLERRARYCVLLEVVPASDRRHKYVGGGSSGVEDGCGNAKGWTSAGPAEPQPRIDRRIYLHPDSPATGAHWMQHPVNFNKLKLTNNAVDPRTNVVLTSMHKYVPRIWIIRCDDVTRLSDLYSHPASSFKFNETEFIAVTAYQNENITKLKINNNPFAKGFRESGQSRCKRKFQQTETETASRVDDEEGNLSSESESNRASNHLDVVGQRPKTASSETGSLDDSGVSSCGGISPPLPLIHRNSPSREIDRDAQPRLHRPWVDSPQFSSTSNTVTSNLSLKYGELNVPYYLLHPSLAALQSELVRLPYQSTAQFSRYY